MLKQEKNNAAKTLRNAKDYAELCLLQRRIDYLKMKTRYIYAVDPESVDDAFSDVRDIPYMRDSN